VADYTALQVEDRVELMCPMITAPAGQVGHHGLDISASDTFEALC
jgi:hypothetical protein